MLCILVVYGFGIVLTVFLAALSWIDARTYRLPDALTFPLIAIGLAQAQMMGNLTQSLIGAMAAYLVMLFVEVSYKRIRGRDGLGRGDAKLLAAGGAWCGWPMLPFIVLIASGAGLIACLLPTMRRRAESGGLPFGPFLSLAIWLVWIALQRAA